MKIIPIKQLDDIACGPTCIEMAARYFGLPYTTEQIAKISGYKKKDGLSNTDLVETLKKVSLKAKQKANCTWANLKKANKDGQVVIVSWMKQGYIGHFSVVENVGDEFIDIVDPEEGRAVRLEKTVFMRLWMDYDDMWYPKVNTDIQLRWMCIVQKNLRKRKDTKTI